MAHARFFRLWLPWLFALVGCTTETRNTETRREASYPGGYRIEVLKKDQYDRMVGMITGHDYGTTHEYQYSFELSPGRISWHGGAAEPKTLVLCPKSARAPEGAHRHEIYLRYLDLESDQPDAGSDLDASIQAPRSVHIVARQARLHDQRYFFKLLGDVHWINIEPNELRLIAGCHEGTIPNGNELTLAKPALER